MPKFKTYDFKLRLEGSVLNEVPKEGLTAAEVDMLRALHGADAVVGLVEAGEVSRSDAAERERVKSLFMNPLLDGPPRLKAKTEMFRDLFGHDSLPMPKALAVAEVVEDEDDEVAEDKPPIRRTRVPKLAAEPEASFTE